MRVVLVSGGWKVTRSIRMPNRSWEWRRVVRLVRLALALAVAIIAVLVVPAWVHALLPYNFNRRPAETLLLGTEIFFGAAFAAGSIGTVSFGALLAWARRRRKRCPIVACGLLFCCACFIGLGIAEAIAKAWDAPPRSVPAPAARDPELPREFAENGDGEGTLVVLGESSAAGVPFEKRLSVGKIVAWQLGEVIPAHRFRASVLAMPGDTLEGQYRQLSELRRRPDVVIVYCGHNEFFIRVPFSRRVEHYHDHQPNLLERADQLVGRISALYALIQNAHDKLGIELPPPPTINPSLIDVPIFTPAEFANSLADFRRRLDRIASFCERVGALLILVVPPGNDADFEPMRSYLPVTTSPAERDAFARDFLAARALESSDPRPALSAYQTLLARQPRFAEAHYRLARLLEGTGEWDKAYEHYVAARDLDGMPVRCLSAFQQAYREVAAQHKCALVDGQRLFHAIGPHGLLNDTLFNDMMHPSLRGHIALATAILDALRKRGALGWSPTVPTPTIDAARCAAHFGLSSADWKTVCRTSKEIYGLAAFLRYDKHQCHAKEQAYERAMRRIAAGEPPETVGLPNVGVR
jgi:lysophospholipase L1-like esterase